LSGLFSGTGYSFYESRIIGIGITIATGQKLQNFRGIAVGIETSLKRLHMIRFSSIYSPGIAMDYRCEDRKRIGELRGDIGANR
jgi:hypothetical protein